MLYRHGGHRFERCEDFQCFDRRGLRHRRRRFARREDGLDEVTISGRTFVAEAEGRNVRSFEISPEDFGLRREPLEGLQCLDAEASAGMIRAVLSAERRDAARSLVIINAATALSVGGLEIDFREAAKLAESTIDSGAALRKLNELIEMTNS